jgi:hypothetical protein
MAPLPTVEVKWNIWSDEAEDGCPCQTQGVFFPDGLGGNIKTPAGFDKLADGTRNFPTNAAGLVANQVSSYHEISEMYQMEMVEDSPCDACGYHAATSSHQTKGEHQALLMTATFCTMTDYP